ncbi:MAG: hypothetical protein COS92_01295 [Desulfobacterales bacterium CG07_land_8_20_14_0_80_52_14]|nr:MAG: hypothetical protein COX20_01900 [Desulfobacterales bacterium CG23_combo_of_CG06-09_8_20_14_all_52_9]PIU50450.1 MAG: hypothetical protein COS92_01295 [Desulfobacterales bacterium CG07_land_8_20_14_0_80_52_14]
MSKVFRKSTREASILSKIESSKEHARRMAINGVKDCTESLSNAIAMKLVETGLVETTSKNSLEEQIKGSLTKLTRAEDFDVDYQVAPFRNMVPQPHVVSMYLTAFVLEHLINHKDIVDIFGEDIEIYSCINQQVVKFLSREKLPDEFT